MGVLTNSKILITEGVIGETLIRSSDIIDIINLLGWNGRRSRKTGQSETEEDMGDSVT